MEASETHALLSSKPLAWRADTLGMSLHTCTSDGCGRTFLARDLLIEHAEAVHTFDDIRMTVADALREKFGSKGVTGSGEARVYVWICDLAEDWVVFEQETTGADTALLKAAYSIIDGEVTFGTPYEVTRKTVYEPVAS